MSSRSTEEASRLTSALTGMSLAVGIAREATDAVPIVKQCLGSAVRIVAFAEKMDKDRQALRELADKSLQLAQRVKDVMGGRKPDAKVETSLQRIVRALESIETFMQKHSARSRLYRLIGYAFTVPQHVERLSRELADAVQELVVVVLLDVDHHVHATHTAVDENARFVGEFRLFRHCEVQKLDRIFDFEDSADSNAVVRYHSAQVEGQVLVVRYFGGSFPQHSSSIQSPEDTMLDDIAFHDSILEEISTVQRSHPHVARIYGWSRGSARDRFTVFKSGYQPMVGVLQTIPDPLTTGIHWTLKVLVEINYPNTPSPLMQDAVHHLQLMGIDWDPSDTPYELDGHLQPIIGLQDDLRRMKENMDRMLVAQLQLCNMTTPLWPYAEQQSVPAARLQKNCPTERLADLIGRMKTTQRERYIISKAEFSGSRILADTTAKNLLRVFEGVAFVNGWRAWMWANILLALDKNRRHALMGSLRVVYHATYWSNRIQLYTIDQDSEYILHDAYTFDVPGEQQGEVREMLGIPALPEGRLVSEIIYIRTYRMLVN